jgi:hypothetical protein
LLFNFSLLSLPLFPVVLILARFFPTHMFCFFLPVYVCLRAYFPNYCVFSFFLYCSLLLFFLCLCLCSFKHLFP